MKENKIIIITAVLNFIVAVLKLISGLLFSFSTLIADSIQSFIDFITDIISIVVNRIGKRRANKIYPFGYGQVYYLANILTSFLLLLIGIFIVYQLIFFNNSFKPDLKIAIILLLVLLLKGIVVKLLQYFGKRYKSELMVEASTESKADFISTCVVLGVLGLSFLEKYIPEFISIDKIGSFGMAIYVFYTAIKMMIYNIRGILANDEDNSEIKDEIEKALSKIKEVEFLKVKVIKMSTYYSVFLQVKVDEDMTMKEYVKYEKKLKEQIKNSNKLIRFIDIEPV